MEMMLFVLAGIFKSIQTTHIPHGASESLSLSLNEPCYFLH